MSPLQSLARLSRAELEAYTFQLEKLLGRKRCLESGGRSAKRIDFKQYGARKIALKLAYQGWCFPAGFTAQPGDFAIPTEAKAGPHSFRSVESALFFALEKVKLVPCLHWLDDGSAPETTKVSPNRPLQSELFGEIWSSQGWQYSRGGRTDKGVSAVGQVVSLLVRCPPPNSGKLFYDYIRLLNKALPESVRIYAWAPVHDDFSARFSARSRTYKYFIPNMFSEEGLCSMKAAAKMMIGRHDFGNFCKFDAETTKGNTERVVLRCAVDLIRDPIIERLCPRGILEFTVEGQAFLYHQVRFMVAVLLEIGRGTESLDLVRSLLGLDGYARLDPKPQYVLAPECPLVLWNVDYGDQEPEWRYALSSSEMSKPDFEAAYPVDLVRSALCQWYTDLTKITFHGSFLSRLLQSCSNSDDAARELVDSLLGHTPQIIFPHMMDPKMHIPIKKRSSTGLNSEERMQKVSRMLERKK
ncbi:tRNA pseudouridine synthase 3 [Cyanidiococcus yangmingshanensis]|uniref:tRNA pseudouridine synthase n=1 Tax=Cyanidiococcus yangmingshanensis TaxID=2690220 RepID=A0A7J7IJS7_9RHOD|nr:tRNA pseudouridine synthase 3 [Cyanidiococcus yangmingshanensis]